MQVYFKITSMLIFWFLTQTMATATLGELTGLFQINQLNLTGLKKCLMWSEKLTDP